MLFADHSRRQKEKIFRSIRQNRVECLLFTSAHIERSAFDGLIVTTSENNTALFQVFNNKTIWVCSAQEFEQNKERFESVQKRTVPIESTIKQQQYKTLIDGLRRQGTLRQTTTFHDVLGQINNEPDREQLLMTALYGFSLWNNMENIDILDNLSKLENKESRPPQKRLTKAEKLSEISQNF